MAKRIHKKASAATGATGPEEKSRITAPQDADFLRAHLSRIEDLWLAERIRGEAESTELLLDESYLGSTSDALPQTKADFLRFVRSSPSTYTGGEHAERDIRFYGDVAVSTGTVTLTSADRESRFRYLRVYRKVDGEWRLVASQSTRFWTV
jgi:hypothetical protein